MTTRIIDLLIPAAVGAQPGVCIERVAGRIITCITATAGFSVRKDNGAKIPLNTGQDTGDINAPEFGSIVFYNLTGAVITARIAVGYTQYTPDKAVSANINQTITVTGQNKDTYPKGSAIVANTNFNGLDGGNKRKQIIVQNRGAQTVEIFVGAVSAFIIAPGDPAFTMECGGSVDVLFTGAGAKDARVLEVFYSP